MTSVPVTVVTGFLGAGKTTLVNRWLADFAPGEIAVIVNEYGAIGIDGALLGAQGRTLIEIAGNQYKIINAKDDLVTIDPEVPAGGFDSRWSGMR